MPIKPIFDWTISFGNILTIAGFFLGLWMAVSRLFRMMDRRLSALEQILVTHAETLVKHGVRMEKQDDLLLRLVGDVQRLIGHLEARSDVTSRRE